MAEEIPTDRPVIFQAAEDFGEEGLQSGYAKDLTYTLLPENEKLRGFVEKWLAEQKVRLLPVGTQAEAVVAGKGTVT